MQDRLKHRAAGDGGGCRWGWGGVTWTAASRSSRLAFICSSICRCRSRLLSCSRRPRCVRGDELSRDLRGRGESPPPFFLPPLAASSSSASPNPFLPTDLSAFVTLCATATLRQRPFAALGPCGLPGAPPPSCSLKLRSVISLPSCESAIASFSAVAASVFPDTVRPTARSRSWRKIPPNAPVELRALEGLISDTTCSCERAEQSAVSRARANERRPGEGGPVDAPWGGRASRVSQGVSLCPRSQR